MATVNKDFKIKQGLIVEGTTATVNGYDLLKKSSADDEYIIGLIGGTATSENTPNTVVKRDGDGKFTATEITADLIGSVTGQVSDISNHSTSNLTEGSRLYFTDQRALDATASAYDVSGAAATAYTNATTFATSADGELYTTVRLEKITSKAEAIAEAAIDATTKADAAQSAAATDATTKANAAQAAAEATASADATTKADAAQSAAATDATTKANAAQAAAEAYTDSEVAALVDSAPELLDTLNELAAAIADNPNYASDVANLVATKADTSYVNSEISDLDTAAQGYASAAQSAAATDATTKANAAEISANNYVDSEIIDALNSAQFYANTAESEANSYTDSRETAITTAYQTYADTAQTFAETFATTAINALDTDDIEEGSTNLYFLDSRAKASAADLLMGATTTNITITGSGSGLTITAENGVADSDTDDLTEGSTNLYFTDARAVSALEAVVPNFTAVELNSVAKQVAATLEAPTAGVQTAYAFAKSAYRSAEFLVKVAYGTHTEISKVLLTLDTSDNIALTEYGIVGTNGSASTVSAGISGTNVTLLVTTNNNNSTVTVMGTLLV